MMQRVEIVAVNVTTRREQVQRKGKGTRKEWKNSCLGFDLNLRSFHQRFSSEYDQRFEGKEAEIKV